MKVKKEKLAVSAKAARILRKVAAHILEEPRRFDMDTWVAKVTAHSESKPPCGTVGCIAGWAVLLAGKRLRYGSNTFGRRDAMNDVALLARKVLGIDDIQGQALFKLSSQTYAHHWPYKYEAMLRAAGSPRQRARVAANRMEHFIKTGE